MSGWRLVMFWLLMLTLVAAGFWIGYGWATNRALHS